MSSTPTPSALKSTPQGVAPKCAVVGVGAAGNAVIERLALERNTDFSLLSVQSDARLLARSMAGEKLALGQALLRGVGTGGDPQLGLEAAEQSRAALRESLEEFALVFVCAGLGGGTGGGAASVVAQEARAVGALVIAAVSMPFAFEGARRRQQAQQALGALRAQVDALLIFDNDRMGELVLPKDGIHKAFAQADQLMAQALRSVAGLLSMDGLVKLGVDDIVAALRSADEGRCLFGLGEARGQNRGADAVKRALKSPLMDQGRLLRQTQSLLVHVCGGESLTLSEVDSIMKLVGRHVSDETKVLFGVSVQTGMGDSVSVMLLSALGLQQLHAAEEEPALPPVKASEGQAAPEPEVSSAAPLPPRSKRHSPAEPAATRPDPLDEVMGNLFAQTFGEAPPSPTPAPVAAETPTEEPTLLGLLTAQMEEMPASPAPPVSSSALPQEPESIAEPTSPEAVIKPKRLTLEDFLSPAPSSSPLERSESLSTDTAAAAMASPLDEPLKPAVTSSNGDGDGAEPETAQDEPEEGMQLPSWLRSARVLGRR